MFSAVLQQHVCVVLAEVSVLFPTSEQCHVDEILGPGLLLGRIDHPGFFVGSHLSSQIPCQISSEPTGHVKSEAQDMEADFS